MMADLKENAGLRKLLAGYYGLLQITHLIILSWAGMIYLSRGQMPFPAQPPAPGWQSQAVPFLAAMGAVDALAAGLGIIFAFQYFFCQRWLEKIGTISLTIALTSAAIFAVGTAASGAWSQHPVSYLSMVVAFFPAFVLYWLVLCGANIKKPAQDEFS